MSRQQKIAMILLIIGCLFIGMGVFRGEHETVGKKANIICLECIGIG